MLLGRLLLRISLTCAPHGVFCATNTETRHLRPLGRCPVQLGTPVAGEQALGRQAGSRGRLTHSHTSAGSSASGCRICRSAHTRPIPSARRQGQRRPNGKPDRHRGCNRGSGGQLNLLEDGRSRRIPTMYLLRHIITDTSFQKRSKSQSIQDFGSHTYVPEIGTAFLCAAAAMPSC
jgi:hypothetical protein